VKQPLENTMLMQALLLTPYIVIAASLVLTVTIAAICTSQVRPRQAGFAV
jgi:hypothetical protein